MIALSVELVFGVSNPLRDINYLAQGDTTSVSSSRILSSHTPDSIKKDSAARSSQDSTLPRSTAPIQGQEEPAETQPKKQGGAFLDDIMTGKNEDSLYYDVKNKKVYIYNKGDVTYQSKNLKSDFMQIDMDSREIFAYSRADTVDGEPTIIKAVYEDGGSSYTMDTITYNLKTSKALIRGVATQEGDGWLIGGHVKKMPDNAINIQGGKYTTCDDTDHPHFYLAMTKAKMIPGKKVVTGYAYLVMEDVPIYFLGIPEGFFPLNTEAKSGLLMPTYGEEAQKGFFLRDMGYYFTLGEYMDLTILGGIYSLGSWETSAASRYTKRYKYNGNVNVNFSNVKLGEKGEPDFSKQNNFRLQWTHSQDAKANPGSTFSASVNFSTSGYNRYSASNLNDILQTQTNSSISYSRNWAGTPYSMSANMSVSQNSQTKALAITLPTIVFNVARFYPLKRKEAIGEQRWYEKISASYSAKMTNSVTASEEDIFSRETMQSMKNGIQHSIPVSASFKALNYIDISPSFNYTERWYFKEENKEWDPVANKVVTLDPNYGFYRLYNYTSSATASTTMYGTYQNKKKEGKIQAIRHTLTPSFGFSYAPDFSDQKYGFYKAVQSDSTGRFQIYSPYSNNAYGVPSSGQSMAMNFGLSQTLEMKVLSDRDTSGVKKVKLIDQLSVGGSYNFLADSMKLSLSTVQLSTTLFGNFGLKLSVGLDPYRVTPEGKRYDKLFFPGRVTSTGWSFGYTFKSSQASTQQTVLNDINSIPPEFRNPFYDPYGLLDPVQRRQYMSQSYYDFSIPWNFGFNYNISYSVRYVNNGTTGYEPNINQTVSFNGSVNVTPKFGVTFNGGYDIMAKKLSATQIAISRDLHCWQMSFSWIPFGYYRSWSFNIGVKAASLADLKYDKSESIYDKMY